MDERTGEKTSKARPARNLIRLQTLIALVLCGGALFWAVQTAREGMHPVKRSARLVRSGDIEERQIAAQQLGDCVPEDLEVAVPALVAALGDDQQPVRVAVASALGTAGLTAMRAEGRQAQAREAARALTRALADSGAEVRSSAAFALGDLAAVATDKTFPGDPASVASAMVGLLADPSILVRTSAESALTRVASKAPLEPPPALVEGLNAWPLKESRKAAAVALGSFKASPGRTVTALTRALGDKEPEVRSDAAVALGKFVPDAAPALPDLIKNLVDPFVPPPPSQASALMPSVRPAGALGGGGGNEPASPTSPTSPTDPAVQAALAIGRIVQGQVEKGAAPAADALEALTRALHSDREALRDAAEEALRRIGKGALSVIPTLIQDLVDSTPKTGAGLGPTAATLLGDIAPGTERAVEAVIALTSAVDANDPAIRIAAIKGLARFGPLASAALPRLREVAGDQGMATDVTTVVQTTIDRIEGKAPPESPRRKGQGRRGRR